MHTCSRALGVYGNLTALPIEKKPTINLPDLFIRMFEKHVNKQFRMSVIHRFISIFLLFFNFHSQAIQAAVTVVTSVSNPFTKSLNEEVVTLLVESVMPHVGSPVPCCTRSKAAMEAMTFGVCSNVCPN